MQPQKGVTMVKEAGDLKGNIIKNKGGEFQQAGCGQQIMPQREKDEV